VVADTMRKLKNNDIKVKKKDIKPNANTDNSDFMIFSIAKSILKQSKKTNDKRKKKISGLIFVT